MRVWMINSVFGICSTGRICSDLSDVLATEGCECKVAYARGEVPERYSDRAVRIGGAMGLRLHGLLTRLTDRHGLGSKRATEKMIRQMEAFKPDVVHLHNLHGYYLHYPTLFKYLKKSGVPVVWTLHDCWSFTGHCSHYDAIGCDRWKEECHDCPQRKNYPGSLFWDGSRKNYRCKKENLLGLPNLTLVTPSEWLKEQVGKSFLRNYPCRVIPNGIDLQVFRPNPGNLREKYGLQGKMILLGVATSWSPNKGLERFLRLAELLGDGYQVILEGLSERQLAELPPNVIGIPLQDHVEELTSCYTDADILVSMSLQETMGLTVVEANACGTPALVFRRTALPELITSKTGVVVENATPEAAAEAIRNTDWSCFQAEDCIRHGATFDKQEKYREYLKLYRSVVQSE